ncbi:hypothetical protein [uncultured Sphingomonas sp.]|uniref:hypothetical protein n=1 Tax=uncultured Sphingomonas sp. TaxID=158754 RepID=UPI0035C951D1
MPPLIIISHYNAWPTDQLVALLDQVATIPAGVAFDVCIVVNQETPHSLVLPERHGHIPILYRENTGYNIGAWDHGWRHNPGYECYLFLQEECRIARSNWLSAHYRLAMQPAIGVVGESMHWAGRSWERLHIEYRDAPFTQKVDGSSVPYPDGIRAGLKAAGLAEGRTGAHLQSLVLCMRRSVLEAIGGFRVGRTYGEAVVAEVLLTKQVEALDLKAREVGPGSFRYIVHPQWADRGGVKRAIGRVVLRNLPPRLAERLRSGIG